MLDIDVLVTRLSRRNPFRSVPMPLGALLEQLDGEVTLADLERTGVVRVVEGEVHLDSEGEARIAGAWRAVLQRGFDRALVGQATSEAYRQFNVAVYGRDAFQFDIVDASQWDQLVRLSNLRPGMTFVDLGCAVGTLTARMAEETGASGRGLDFAPTAIELARERYASRDDLHFDVGDLDALPAGGFDVAFAIDTLYFASDLARTLDGVKALLVPHGRLLAPYTWIVDAGPADHDPAATPLGKALDTSAWDWVAFDVTPAGHGIWNRAREVLPGLEAAFRDEGLEATWQSRIAEATRVGAAYDEGRARRFLYAAQRRDADAAV